MLALAYYILKVIICSAVLYGYYWFFLRNKIFHSYNRFYLLATIVLSLLLPLMKFNVWEQEQKSKTSVVQMLQVVSSGDAYMNEVIIQSHYHHINKEEIAWWVFIIICSVFALIFIMTISQIYSLKKNNIVRNYHDIDLIDTNDKRTPFSFFKNIFWNNKIDINSDNGKCILKHELVHVQEKHSYDKLFINIVLIFFWCNPVFWLIRKELNMIHEFIADKKAVEDGDAAAFAAMILAAVYPGQRFGLTNNFFYSPIKRRLAMLIKDNRMKVNYISRLLALPLVIIVFAAFTLKAKKYITSLPKGRIVTVVIDAGHGGSDKGATGIDGSDEKDINLLLVKKIRELNKDENLKIILTRETDLYQDPKEKALFTNKINPDLFVSIHLGSNPVETKNSSKTFESTDIDLGSDVPEGSVTVSAAGKTLKEESDYKINYKEGKIQILNKSILDAAVPVQVNFAAVSALSSGLQIYVSKDEYRNSNASSLFASAVLNSFQNNYPLILPEKPIQRKAGIWVLQEAKCPAILIEAGNISNKNELIYLQSDRGQEQFAKNILSAISAYEISGDVPKVNVEISPAPITQQLHAENHLHPLKDTNPTFKPLLNKIEQDMFIDATQVVVTDVGDVNVFGVKQFNLNKIFPEPLVILNGRESTLKKIKNIDPEEFDYLRILKPETAIPVYGQKSRYGVLIINTKFPGNGTNFPDGKTYLQNVVFKIGDLSGVRLNATEFKKQKAISLSPPLHFLSATVYFSGEGFDKVETAVLTKPQLSGIGELIDRCVAGTAITFDDIRISDEKNNEWLVEGKSYILVGNPQSQNEAVEKPSVNLSGITAPHVNIRELHNIKELKCNDRNYRIVSASVYFSGENFQDVLQDFLEAESLMPLEEHFKKIINGSVVTFDNILVEKKDGSDRMTLETRSFAFYSSDTTAIPGH